jgi:hypothetical protein
MTDLRKAAEMALEALEMFCEHGAILRPIETKEALRQALAMENFSEVNQELKQALAQPEQEPVIKNMTLACPSYLHGYTAPPKREWVGLTDEEIRDLRSWSVSRAGEDSGAPTSQHAFARAIEAKLKEKNLG